MNFQLISPTFQPPSHPFHIHFIFTSWFVLKILAPGVVVTSIHAGYCFPLTAFGQILISLLIYTEPRLAALACCEFQMTILNTSDIFFQSFH